MPSSGLTHDGRTIAGYYALSQYAADSGSPPDEHAQPGPSQIERPATLLGRLARSLSFKGQRVGELLLISALKQALDHSRPSACMAGSPRAPVVDAKDAPAKNFYKRYGCLELPDHLGRFLPMKTIEQTFANPG